ncbi:MAG: DUF2490 domain-containing protein [Methylacidiphilales bacterium]|nr:DUF2490 domain-containing protein [Candidatus Methylacidiphilales bacterium]
MRHNFVRPAHHFWLGLLPGVCLLAVALARGAPPPPSTDDQLWDETRLTYKLTPEFNVFTAGEFRLTDDFGYWGRTSGRVGMGWQPLSNFTIMPSYLYTVDDPASSTSRVESTLCLLTSYRIPIKTATFTLLNTTEYRMPEGLPASWRLRPKCVLSQPIGPDNLGLSGFIANEGFYDEGRNAWTQDRVFGGLEKKLGSYADVELYYCREFNFPSNRPDFNVIGITVRLTFGPKKLPTPDEPDTQ